MATIQEAAAKLRELLTEPGDARSLDIAVDMYEKNVIQSPSGVPCSFADLTHRMRRLSEADALLNSLVYNPKFVEFLATPAKEEQLRAKMRATDQLAATARARFLENLESECICTGMND